MHPIFELHAFTPRLNKILHFVEVAELAWFEPLRIVKDKPRILRRDYFGVDVAYSMRLMGHGLFHI